MTRIIYVANRIKGKLFKSEALLLITEWKMT